MKETATTITRDDYEWSQSIAPSNAAAKPEPSPAAAVPSPLTPVASQSPAQL